MRSGSLDSISPVFSVLTDGLLGDVGSFDGVLFTALTWVSPVFASVSLVVFSVLTVTPLFSLLAMVFPVRVPDVSDEFNVSGTVLSSLFPVSKSSLPLNKSGSSNSLRGGFLLMLAQYVLLRQIVPSFLMVQPSHKLFLLGILTC